MTDLELTSKLKSVPAPERSPEYWENFPAQVRAQLRGAGFLPARQAAGRHYYSRPRLAWGVSLAAACVIFGLVTWPSFHAVLQHEKAFRRELAQFPVNFRALMQDDHGMHYLIADQP